MKKLKQGLLLAVLLLLGAYVTIPLIKREIQHQHTQKLNELYKSTGYDYLRTEIAGSEGNDMIIGIYEDGDGYSIATACLPDQGEGELLYTPMYSAETGAESVRLWYGICGNAQEPQLLLYLDEDDPLCRSMELDGADHRSMSYIQDIFVDTMLTDLNGLVDNENRLTVSLFAAEGVDFEIKPGFNMVENMAPDVLTASEELNKDKQLYLQFSIDLTEALARTGW